MKKLSIILFLIAIEKARSQICPDGSSSTGYAPCGDDLCFGSSGHEYCCALDDDKSLKQCTHTGMRSAVILAQNYQVSTSSEIRYAIRKDWAHYSAYVYDVTIDNREFVCPYPIGYLWFNKYDTFDGIPPQEMLPTDHIDISAKLTSCELNENCASNEFCGHVINRSYRKEFAKCYTDGKACNTDSECPVVECGLYNDNNPYVDLDKKFCYKIPSVRGLLSDKAQYIVKNDELGLKMCDVDNDCGPGEKCQLTAGGKWATYDDTNAVKLVYQGMCIEAKPFSQTLSFNYLKVHQYDQSSQKIFLPVDMENKKREELRGCQKNSECTNDSQFCGYAYSLPGSAPSSDKYCYALPEEHQNLLVKPDGVDLVVCDLNEECDGKLCSIIPNRKYSSTDKKKMARGLCTTQEPVKKSNNNMIIIIVLAVALVVAILVALVGGFVLSKKISKNGGKKDEKDKNIANPSTATNTTSKAEKSRMGKTI